MKPVNVVPLAGTWIETVKRCQTIFYAVVVPLAGTWIETELCSHSARVL